MRLGTALLVASAFLLFSGCGADQSKSWEVRSWEDVLEQVGKISELGNPEQFIVTEDTVLYLVDRALNGLHRYNLRTGELSEGTGLGQGPGEVATAGPGYLARYGSNQIWLHDTGQQQISIYNTALDLDRQMPITGSMRSLPLDDSLIANVPFGPQGLVDIREALAHIEGGNLEHALWVFRAAEHDVFKVVPENFLLKYGPMVSCGESVVAGFDFASYLLRIRKSGVELLKDLPSDLKIPFPPPDPDLPENYGRLPNWFHPRGTLDLACDRKHIYVLYSGKRVSRAKARSLDLAGRLTKAKRAEMNARVRQSDRLHVYERGTGTFLHEIQLPVEARKLAATRNHIYLLVHEQEGPAILRLAWREEHRS